MSIESENKSYGPFFAALREVPGLYAWYLRLLARVAFSLQRYVGDRVYGLVEGRSLRRLAEARAEEMAERPITTRPEPMKVEEAPPTPITGVNPTSLPRIAEDVVPPSAPVAPGVPLRGRSIDELAKDVLPAAAPDGSKAPRSYTVIDDFQPVGPADAAGTDAQRREVSRRRLGPR